METNETNKTEQTKFEELLSQMSLDDKGKVFDSLMNVNDTFKEYVEKDGKKWLDVMCGDEPLRIIFTCCGVASQMWYFEYRKKEMETQNEES